MHVFLRTFLPVMEKPNVKYLCSFLYRLERSKFVFILKFHIVLCRMLRGSLFLNVDTVRHVAIYARSITAPSLLHRIRAAYNVCIDMSVRQRKKD